MQLLISPIRLSVCQGTSSLDIETDVMGIVRGNLENCNLVNPALSDD